MSGAAERKFNSPAPQLKRGVVVRRDQAPVFRGRRAYIEYADFGVADATSGALKIYYVSSKSAGQDINYTGWHYHDCDWQWSFVVKGFIDVAWEDGTTERVTAGCSIFIPGGLIHNETNISEDLEVIEMMCPGEMGTYPCDPPPAFADAAAE